MTLDPEHPRNKDIGESGSNLVHAFNFKSGYRQSLTDFFGVGFNLNKFAQPAEREFHRAASPERKLRRKRRSFSKNNRMSSTPSLSSEVRSTPIPKAKP